MFNVAMHRRFRTVLGIGVLYTVMGMAFWALQSRDRSGSPFSTSSRLEVRHRAMLQSPQPEKLIESRAVTGCRTRSAA
jgi:hypothetical protein